MEYQKITNLLDHATNQASKFKTRNWAEINDESKGRYDTTNVRFKTSTIRSNLCDYSDVYFIVKACVRYFSLFLKGKCISLLFRTKYIEKKFSCFSSHCFTNIYSLLGYPRYLPP